MYVTSGMIQTYGKTDGCPGCRAIGTGRTTTHSEICRNRLKGEFSRSEEGRAVLEKNQERVDDHLHRALNKDIVQRRDRRALLSAGCRQPRDHRPTTHRRAAAVGNIHRPQSPERGGVRGPERYLQDNCVIKQVSQKNRVESSATPRSTSEISTIGSKTRAKDH